MGNGGGTGEPGTGASWFAFSHVDKNLVKRGTGEAVDETKRLVAHLSVLTGLIMPTVLRVGPYRFFFYAGDRAEPPHIHVERNDCQAKFWLAPPRLQSNKGFKNKELRKIAGIIEENQEELMESWVEYFNQ